MPASIVARHAAQASGNGTFSPTLVGTGSNRLIVVIGLATAGGTQTLDSLTLNGQAGQQVASSRPTVATQHGNISVYVFTDSQHPGAGSFTFTPAWSAVSAAAYLVYECSEAKQSAPFITGFTTPDSTPDVATATVSAALSGAQNLLGLFFAGMSSNSSAQPTASNVSASLANPNNTDVGFHNCWLLGYEDEVVATAGETYSADVNLNRAFSASDNIFSGTFAVNDAEANIDPVLDTPQSDVTIQEGQSGTIQAGANFSDANPGDTLTFSISPSINPVQGFTFNTSTGAIVYDGSQVAAGAVSYTVTCDDGNGGTPATDTFTITVIPPQFAIGTPSTTTPTAGTTLTVTFSNEAGAITASCSAGAMTGTYSAGQFVLDVPEPPLFGNQTLTYQQNVVVTFSDGVTTQQLTIQIQVPSGELFAEITSIDPDGVYANDAGLAVGDFAHFKNIAGNIVIDPATGLYSADPSQNTQFSYSIYDVSTGDWSDAYQTNTYTAESEPPVITLNGSNPLVWVQGTAWVDPQATVTDNVDATRQINADNAPSINTVGAYTLNYNATDAAGNAATQVTRTVNVVASDTVPNQFTFTDVNNAELNTLYENIQPVIDVDAGQTLTVVNGQLSNDNGATWASSVQMVTGQTLVKASITTSGANSLEHTQVVTVNGVSDTFSVTTKAAVTRTFSIGSSAPVVNGAGANVTYTYPIWELWDKIPEDPTAVIIDSGVNFTVTNGVGSVQTSSAQLSTNYIFIARDSGNTPANYIRTLGQVA